MTDDDLGYDPNYWHSDHYRAQTDNPFIGPVWDVLADNPQGVTVPQIRDALVDDKRIRSVQSWLLSFGAEQKYRQPEGNARMQERYKNMDPSAPDPGHWTWNVEQRYRYALTERIHWNIRNMVKEGTAVTVGSHKVEKPEIFHLITGMSQRVRNAIPAYAAGEVPLITAINPRCQCGKYHHPTYKRLWVHHEGLGPDPYALRMNWVKDVEVALRKPRIVNVRELLEQGLEVLRALE
jgi:hypothetical protein